MLHHKQLRTLNRIAGVLLALLAAGTLPLSAPAQSVSVPISSDYLVKVFQRDDGLPHNTISAIVQAGDGYLWIGSHEGLAKFDGLKFTIYSAPETSGLESDHVDCLAAAQDGSVWIGLERGGIARWYEEQFEMVSPLSAYTNTISTITPYGQDAFWAGLTFGRMDHWSKGSLKVLDSQHGLPAQGRVFSQIDSDGRLWFASDNSFGYFENDICVPLITNSLEYFRIARHSDEGIWMVRKGELQHIKADFELATYESTTLTSLIELGDSGIEVIYEDSTGALWLGTRGNGLYIFSDGKLARVPVSHDFILSICEDQEGDIWVGTWGGGLNRLHRKLLQVYNADTGLPNSLLLSLCEDNDGSIWIASRSSPPVSIPPDRTRPVSQRRGWGTAPASVLCRDYTGGIWLAAQEKGLFHWKNGAYADHGFHGVFIFSLFQDSKTNLWIGTLKHGLFELQPGGTPRRMGNEKMMEITVITEDQAGTMWVGTQQGTLHRRKSGEAGFTEFGAAEGLPWQKAQTIFCDGPDSLWIGTRGGGLVRFKNGRFKAIKHAQGIPDDDIRQIIADNSDGMWIGTSQGLFRAGKDDLEQAANNPDYAVECVFLGTSFGLNNFEFQEGFRNSVLKTRDGNLWFATTRGAVEVNPARNIFDSSPPPVLIEGIFVDGKPLPIRQAAAVEIPSGSGRVEITYTALSFSAPENVRFRHRLENLDNNWMEDGERRSVTYFRMPPGDYRFRVIARGSSGIWNQVGANIAFTVKPTIWETVWFRVAVIAASVLVVGATVRITLLRRIRRRVRELEQANALENERRRIARDMHDELGASLTRLSLMSEQVRRDPRLDPEVSPKVERISETATEVAHTLDQIVWSVNPGNDTLERLIGYLSHHSAEFLSSTSIRLTQELPELATEQIVNSDVRHQLFLSFKEALNNAVKHSGATEIKLRIRLDQQMLSISVEDNGKGFDVPAAEGKGEGLTTLRSRLVPLGGSCRLESAPGKGTRVILELPLQPIPK
jgi:signal transduction histidine kinase/ligand-binding sensor domain-containing protein